MKLLHCLLAILLSFPLLGQPTRLQLEDGAIEGEVLAESEIRVFKGIPFAAPPVGDLRWKAPQPAEPWEGVRSCTAFGPSPMQAKPAPFMFWSSEFLIPEEPISEDCLYLNVWTGAKEPDEKLPVLVYIYGGGFRSGGSACPIYDGEAMAKKDVVFVSINYRVGVFGFFAHPELSAEAPYGSSGNYALLDMIAGLKWVQENIAAFGGDPGNVTIAGQSAGAFAVNFLTASPLAKGLFHRAIAQSGGSFYTQASRPQMSMEAAEKMGVEFAERLGAKNLAGLRELPAETILEAQGGLSFPLVDGYVMPQSIYETFAQGKQNDVPTIVGWNEEDVVMMRPASADEYRQQVEERFGDLSADFLEVYPAGNEAQLKNSQIGMNRDGTFGIQNYTWAKMQTRTGDSPAFIYNFNRELPAHTPETQFGAFHTGEVVYAYDNLHTLDRPWEPVDQKIADTMSAYWANFAKSGDPNGPGLPDWPAYEPENEEVMILDTRIEAKPLPTLKELETWENFFQSQ